MKEKIAKRPYLLSAQVRIGRGVAGGETRHVAGRAADFAEEALGGFLADYPQESLRSSWGLMDFVHLGLL
jgi:hypothetical protein